MLRKILLVTLVCIPLMSFAQTATEIADRMINRDDGDTIYQKVTLLSCRFKAVGESKKCLSQPRRKVFESVTKDVKTLKDGSRDTIGLSILLEPPDEKGVGFLQKDFAKDKDTEQWLYLPALKKLKRIVSEGKNKAKTGSFFGSVISYEDIEKIHVTDYQFKLVKTEKVDGRETWLLESVPTPSRAPKTTYGRSLIWVDQETFIPLKTEYYSWSGEHLKTIRSLDLEKIGRIWINRRFVALDHVDSKMSMLQTEKILLNHKIPEDLLGIRALNDPEYREKEITPLRESSS